MASLLCDVTGRADDMLSSSAVRSCDCVTETGDNPMEGRDGMEGRGSGVINTNYILYFCSFNWKKKVFNIWTDLLNVTNG